MDGYAVRAGPAGRTLRVSAESRAGVPSDTAVADGEAIRISTGAAVPPGADAVIRQEDVTASEDEIETRAATEPGDNIRGAGEDMRAGAPVLRAGTTLRGAELGAAVSAGASELLVSRRPRVVVLCTGDELRAPGEPLRPGEIHNSNAPMLVSLAARCGAITQPASRLPDDGPATEAGLRAAVDVADVVIVSGGVSVGPHDHVKPSLARLGTSEVFWGVALQPGRPTWFGTRGRTLVFGLPGNPVSAVVTFSLFVRPALAALQGARPAPQPIGEAALGVAVPRRRAVEQALRVRLHTDNGRAVAVPNGPQGSHMVSSLLGADALALVPAGDGELHAGSLVALEELAR
jgi:molybdopterin molybdotransferase